jgi:hypothetical protein
MIKGIFPGIGISTNVSRIVILEDVCTSRIRTRIRMLPSSTDICTIIFLLFITYGTTSSCN